MSFERWNWQRESSTSQRRSEDSSISLLDRCGVASGLHIHKHIGTLAALCGRFAVAVSVLQCIIPGGLCCWYGGSCDPSRSCHYSLSLSRLDPHQRSACQTHPCWTYRYASSVLVYHWCCGDCLVQGRALVVPRVKVARCTCMLLTSMEAMALLERR